MKRLFTLLVLGLVCVPTLVQAQATLDPQRIAAISQRCTVIQTILDQLQRRDLVARTNRGRAYEAQIKQIDALTKRMHINNVSTATLDGPASNFKANVDSFRAAYVLYDDGMTALRQIDCHKKPEDFANILEQVRVLRQATGVEVAKGEESLGMYRLALEELRTTLPVGKGGPQ